MASISLKQGELKIAICLVTETCQGKENQQEKSDKTNSGEDALILSYALFGLDPMGERLGVEVVVTTDYAMRERWQRHSRVIGARFHRMTCQLQAPYRKATLPTVLTPEEVLETLTG